MRASGPFFIGLLVFGEKAHGHGGGGSGACLPRSRYSAVPQRAARDVFSCTGHCLSDQRRFDFFVTTGVKF